MRNGHPISVRHKQRISKGRLLELVANPHLDLPLSSMHFLRPFSIFFVSACLVILVLFMEQCTSLCQKEFIRGSPGIRRHRDSCTIFQNVERERLARRKANRASIAPVSGRRPFTARHLLNKPAFVMPAPVAVRFISMLLLQCCSLILSLTGNLKFRPNFTGSHLPRCPDD